MWSKGFMEAGKRLLAGDTAHAATTDGDKDLRREFRDLKDVVAEQTLEPRLLKKACIHLLGNGKDANAKHSKPGACNTASSPHNVTNQMSQILA